MKVKVCTVPSKPAFAPVTIQITIEDEGDLAWLWAMANYSSADLKDSTKNHYRLQEKALKKWGNECGCPMFECIDSLATTAGLKD